MTRESKIALVMTIILGGFIAAAGCHYFLYSQAAYPWNTFLFRPVNRFSDFLTDYRIALDPYHIAQGNYQNFPFLYLLARLFHIFNPTFALVVILAIYTAVFMAFCMHFFKASSKLLTVLYALIALLSYPYLWALDRANFTFMSFILIVIFLIFYQRRSPWAVLLLAAAIALKITNAVFLVLLLADKKYLELVLSGLGTGLITLGSYAILPGGTLQNIHKNLASLHLYTRVYVLGNEGIYFGHSLFGALKYVYIGLKHKLITPATVTRLMPPYPYIVILIFGAIAVYIVFCEKTLWRKLLLILLPMLLFPYVSMDYNLLFIFIPLFYFVNQSEKTAWDWFYVVSLALLLIPKDYFRLILLPEASMEVLVNPLIMLVILGVTLGREVVAALQGRRAAAPAAVEAQSQA